MVYFIFLAVLNGVFIGTSRAINSQLSMDIGPFRASFWNHIIGFAFLTTLFILTGNLKLSAGLDTSLFIYLGGFFGALFVAVNSYVFPRMGAVKTALLVISGQMISSVIIDYYAGNISRPFIQLLGVSFILLGIYLSKTPLKQNGEKR